MSVFGKTYLRLLLSWVAVLLVIAAWKASRLPAHGDVAVAIGFGGMHAPVTVWTVVILLATVALLPPFLFATVWALLRRVGGRIF